MFTFAAPIKSRSKCYFTHCALPTSNEGKQGTNKQPPFSTLKSINMCHTVDWVLPQELYEIIQQKLVLPPSNYARVQMSLEEVLTGDFFNTYIKSGSIIMRSEGRKGVDDLFWLCEGTLHIEVDKPTYERAGLAGKAIDSGGRKHMKARYAIEHDLRLSSMVRGKKGFERLLYAAKNVLNDTKTWLFVDLRAASTPSPTDKAQSDVRKGAIAKFQPTWFSGTPTIAKMENMRIPAGLTLATDSTCERERSNVFTEKTYAEDLLEWLGMLILHSPRLSSTDEIDPFLCVYQIPVPPLAVAAEQDGSGVDVIMEDEGEEGSVRHIRWRGVMDPRFVKKLYSLAREAAATTQDGKKGSQPSWFAIAGAGFEGRSYMLLHRAFAPDGIEGESAGRGGDVLCWEVVD